jgi:hypothetical protein
MEWATSCKWRTAELLDGLNSGTHRGRGGEAGQSTRGRTGLGTECKAETPRMNVSIEGSGGGKSLWVGENCFYRKIPLIITKKKDEIWKAVIFCYLEKDILNRKYCEAMSKSRIL